MDLYICLDSKEYKEWGIGKFATVIKLITHDIEFKY